MAVVATSPAAGLRNPDNDIRPIVGQERGNRPLWSGLGVIGLLALVLFASLNARRTALSAPAVRPRASDLAAMPSNDPPPLFVPPAVFLAPAKSPLTEGRKISAGPVKPAVSITAPPPPSAAPPYIPSPPPAALAVPKPPADASSAIVFDQTTADTPTGETQASQNGPTLLARVATAARATRVGNRDTVVPRGTLISAVLETALDSTQPGLARALVARDVVSLRGNRVLIPRGSRLYGEYRGELAAGQKRALVQWTQLFRPDGVAIAIDSPAADRLGRAGIKGKVDTHFAERLGGMLLQSVIDIGTLAGSRALNDSPVLVALPNAAQATASQLVGPAPRPMLRVRQGVRIAVFVSRDLDFTPVETTR
jgi:type IV secretion system protein VirB10